MEEVKAAIRSEPLLAAHFDIGETYIRTKSGRIKYVFSGLDRNIDSIKSTSRILLAWIEEAETVTEEAWVKLIPTLREEDSELWLTRSEEHTSELQSLMRISYAVFCLKKKKKIKNTIQYTQT